MVIRVDIYPWADIKQLAWVLKGKEELARSEGLEQELALPGRVCTRGGRLEPAWRDNKQFNLVRWEGCGWEWRWEEQADDDSVQCPAEEFGARSFGSGRPLQRVQQERKVRFAFWLWLYYSKMADGLEWARRTWEVSTTPSQAKEEQSESDAQRMPLSQRRGDWLIVEDEGSQGCGLDFCWR